MSKYTLLCGIILAACLLYASVSLADMWVPVEFEPMTKIDCGE